MGRVSGKVAIVTGGAGGLGAARSRGIVEEGGNVLLTDLNDQQGAALAKALGPHALPASGCHERR
jgi:NAD(P)-dependent dehydrogenase (short-subunit alcohol dehydrogenase family)